MLLLVGRRVDTGTDLPGGLGDVRRIAVVISSATVASSRVALTRAR